MRRLAFCLLFCSLAPAHAEEADDWRVFGHVLTVVQQLVRAQAEAPDAESARRGVDAILAGRNAAANRAAGELLSEVLREMPPEQRGAFTAIARDMLIIMRREQQDEALRAPRTLR